MRDEVTSKTMDLKRLEELLDAYGGRDQAWPAHEREQALALLAESEVARRMREEALALDATMDALPALEPSAALRASILSAVPKPRRSWMERLDGWASRMWPVGPNWQPAAALALAAALGLLVGSIVPNGEVEEQTDFTEIAFGDYSDLGDEAP